MCHYTHLTPFEREKILFFLAEGKSITEIAHLLKHSKETASQERQRRTSWQVRHIASHRGSSCQCGEPFRPWSLGSGYRGGQAGKGMPRHVGGSEEPVLAWWKGREQDRRCCQ